MKHTLKYMIPALVAVACVTAEANVTANFEGSTARASYNTSISDPSPDWNGTLTSAANLNAGTAGGTWSVSSTSTEGNDTLIDVANGAYMANNQLIMGINPYVNDQPAHNTIATLSFAAMNLDGLSISLDASLLGYGGQPGQTYIDLMNGATVVARISGSADAGEGRGSINHYSAIGAYGANDTLLAPEGAIWGYDQLPTIPVVNIAMVFGAAGFSLDTTGANANASEISTTGLSYINTATTVDSIRITAYGSKAAMAFDNITAIPEPATLGLVATFGGAVLFIRRWLAI